MKTSSRLVAGAVVAASAVMPLAFAAPAFAAGPNPSTIDASQSGSLAIHKYLGNPTGQTSNGQPVDVSSGTPLEGIAYDVYQVQGVDLTSNEGWHVADDLRGVSITRAAILSGAVTGKSGAVYQLSSPSTVSTGANGEADYTGKLGLVLVEENLAKSTNPKAASLSPSAPFFVTLPMTDANNLNAWDYSIDVYPKNQDASLTKQVLDGNKAVAGQDAFAVGQNLTYRLESSISATDTNGDKAVTGADIGFYFIADKLPAQTAYQSVSVSVVDKAGARLDTLAEDTDFVVSNIGGTTGISMTSAGLDKLAAHDGALVRADLVAKVVSEGATGIIDNTASFIPSNAWIAGHGSGTPGVPGQTPPTDIPEGPGGTPGIPSNEVESRFGDIVIKKTAQDTGAALAGAVFAVSLDANGNGACDADELANRVATSQPTNTSGFTEVLGLQLSDFYNGAQQTTTHGYCITEIQAPVGYELLAQPIGPFNLTVAGDRTDLTDALVVAGQGVAVVDMPSNLGNQLPQAGAKEIIAFSALGSLAGVVGVGLYFGAKRRNDKES